MTSTTASSLGFSFGSSTSVAPSMTAVSSSGALSTASAQPTELNLTTKSTASASAANTSSVASTSATSSNVTSTTWTSAAQTNTTTLAAQPITFGQLEDNLNKWVNEVDELEKMFLNQSLQINSWDRILMENSEKILSLKGHFEHLKSQQEELEQELDFIVSQQKELDDVIVPLEKELSNVPSANSDRKETYEIAENIDGQLKQMSEEIKEIVESLNESNRCQDSNDPLLKIGRILNVHMNSLQWIDRSMVQIENNLEQVNKLSDAVREDYKLLR